MLQLAKSDEGERYKPIDTAHGFIFSCEKIVLPNNVYTLDGIPDQDFVHNHKKLVNHLFHAARILMIGQNIAHSNHLVQIFNTFPYERHGLTKEDVQRNDRQNWRSAQRICFEQVQRCFEELRDGHNDNPPDPTVVGTLTFLQVIWYYIEIFCSKKASLSERVRYAGLVINFLGIWRNYIKDTPGMTLSKNFLSRETFTDILLSCHTAVFLICYMRDCFPNNECMLELTGTDLVESYFSSNGQMVDNQRAYIRNVTPKPVPHHQIGND